MIRLFANTEVVLGGLLIPDSQSLTILMIIDSTLLSTSVSARMTAHVAWSLREVVAGNHTCCEEQMRSERRGKEIRHIKWRGFT